MIEKKRDPKPKIFFTAAILLVLCILGYQLLFPTPVPSSDGVIQLLQKAEAVYQPGNTQLLSCAASDVDGYEVVSDYDQVVQTIFTSEGIQQLEQAAIDGKPLIRKEQDQVLRLSADETSSAYFDNIQAAKLLDQQDNLFAFRIEFPSPDDGQTLQTDVVVAMQEDGSLLLYSLHYPSCDQ